MKKYNITSRISKQARQQIQYIIDEHEKYRHSFMFHPKLTAYGRRQSEMRFAESHEPFVLIKNDNTITVSMDYSESCKNVYYKLCIVVHNTKTKQTEIKSIKTLKDLLKK